MQKLSFIGPGRNLSWGVHLDFCHKLLSWGREIANVLSASPALLQTAPAQS